MTPPTHRLNGHEAPPEHFNYVLNYLKDEADCGGNLVDRNNNISGTTLQRCLEPVHQTLANAGYPLEKTAMKFLEATCILEFYGIKQYCFERPETHLQLAELVLSHLNALLHGKGSTGADYLDILNRVPFFPTSPNFSDSLQANQYFQIATQLGSYYPDYLFLLGKAYLLWHAPWKGLLYFNAYIEKKPEDTATRAMLGTIYVNMGLPSLAIPHYQRVIQEDPRNTEYPLLLADAYLATRQYPEVEKIYDELLKSKELDSPTLTQIIKLYLELSNKYAEAENPKKQIEIQKKLIKIYKKHPLKNDELLGALHGELAINLDTQKQFEEALIHYREALKLYEAVPDKFSDVIQVIKARIPQLESSR